MNHLMYIDYVKLFAKYKKELETLIHAVRIYSQDIGIEFGIENAMLVIKSGKRRITDGMELLNKDKIRTVREKTLQVFRLSIYHLFVWSNLNFLDISQWIT